MSGIARVSDTKSVVKFVKHIEKQPCLYDIKSHEYLNQALKRKAWMKIAKKWNSTVAECKDKWRKIRTAYTRSLKPKYRNNKWLLPSRPYYLASYLKFIEPTNSGRHSPPPSNNKIDGSDNGNDNSGDSDEEADDKLDSQYEDAVEMLKENDCFDDEDDECYDENETLMDSEENKSHETNGSEKTKLSKHVPIKNSVESRNSEIIDQRCSYCAIESKPRKMLLFSLLPDIEALSEQQMRVFRRELIDLVDKCKYDVNDE